MGPAASEADTQNAPMDNIIPTFKLSKKLKVIAGRIIPAVVLIPSVTKRPEIKLL
ncbi:MAG: hypothetical protein NVSMB45_12620 [Ginsengibacter sp.]